MKLSVDTRTGKFFAIAPGASLPEDPARKVFEADAEMLEALAAPGAVKLWEPVEGSEFGRIVTVRTPVDVPQVIESWQAKAIMQMTTDPLNRKQTLLAAVKKALAAIVDPSVRIVLTSAFENNAPLHRNSVHVANLGKQLGLTEEEINDLFTKADSLHL